jgi:hypothetical protein
MRKGFADARIPATTGSALYNLELLYELGEIRTKGDREAGLQAAIDLKLLSRVASLTRKAGLDRA